MDHRERLHELVAMLPGASTRMLAAECGLAETTAGYHLERLAREGLVRSQIVGRDRCWYRSGCGLCPVLRRALPVLRRPAAASVALALSATPATAGELARRTGTPTGAVRWAATELERTLLLARTRQGRLALRPGAEVCLAAATEGRACPLWGQCALSLAWREALAGPQGEDALRASL
jgi:predicted transcriptional regulator